MAYTYEVHPMIFVDIGELDEEKTSKSTAMDHHIG